MHHPWIDFKSELVKDGKCTDAQDAQAYRAENARRLPTLRLPSFRNVSLAMWGSYRQPCGYLKSPLIKGCPPHLTSLHHLPLLTSTLPHLPSAINFLSSQFKLHHVRLRSVQPGWLRPAARLWWPTRLRWPAGLWPTATVRSGSRGLRPARLWPAAGFFRLLLRPAAARLWPAGPEPPGVCPSLSIHFIHYVLTDHSGYEQQQGAPGEAQEGERGLAGALAGGAAGGFAGHKVNHGFLGTIGGAIIGSIAEDAVKKHRNSDNQSPPQYGAPPPNGQYGGGPPSHNGSGGGSMMDQLGGFFKK